MFEQSGLWAHSLESLMEWHNLLDFKPVCLDSSEINLFLSHDHKLWNNDTWSRSKAEFIDLKSTLCQSSLYPQSGIYESDYRFWCDRTWLHPSWYLIDRASTLAQIKKDLDWGKEGSHSGCNSCQMDPVPTTARKHCHLQFLYYEVSYSILCWSSLFINKINGHQIVCN